MAAPGPTPSPARQQSPVRWVRAALRGSMAVMLNPPRAKLEASGESIKLDGTELAASTTTYVVEVTPAGARLHLTADVDLEDLGVDVEVFQAAPPDWRAAALLAMKPEEWDAIVMGRPSMGEGSNPGAKIVAYIEQMEPPAQSGG